MQFIVATTCCLQFPRASYTFQEQVYWNLNFKLNAPLLIQPMMKIYKLGKSLPLSNFEKFKVVEIFWFFLIFKCLILWSHAHVGIKSCFNYIDKCLTNFEYPELNYEINQIHKFWVIFKRSWKNFTVIFKLIPY